MHPASGFVVGLPASGFVGGVVGVGVGAGVVGVVGFVVCEPPEEEEVDEPPEDPANRSSPTSEVFPPQAKRAVEART